MVIKCECWTTILTLITTVLLREVPAIEPYYSTFTQQCFHSTACIVAAILKFFSYGTPVCISNINKNTIERMVHIKVRINHTKIIISLFLQNVAQIEIKFNIIPIRELIFAL